MVACESCEKRKAQFRCEGWQSNFCWECCSDFNCPAFPVDKRLIAYERVDRRISMQFTDYGIKLSPRQIYRAERLFVAKHSIKWTSILFVPILLSILFIGINSLISVLLLLSHVCLWIVPLIRKPVKGKRMSIVKIIVKELRLHKKSRKCPESLLKRIRQHFEGEK